MDNSLLTEIIYKSTRRRFLTFVRNDPLFREGEEASGVYIIISGGVKITKHNKPDTSIILRIANEGEALGIHTVINEQEHTTSAIALVKTKTHFIPADEFLLIIKDNMRYRLNVMKMLCSNINVIEANINIRSQKTAGERLADILISLVRTYGTDEDGYINLELPRGDFAELVGTSREYIARLVHEFSKSGLISTPSARGRIKVLNLERLETLAGLEKSVPN